jgi:glycosyltransferase involved in cell wall biosynthesis
MRKKILYSSDGTHITSGFSKHAKLLLKYLYTRKNTDGTPKYEVIEAAQGTRSDDPVTRSKPWKCIGLIPADEQSYLQGQPKGPRGENDPNLGRIVSYGAAGIEDAIRDVKPDLAIFCQDYWGFQVLRKYSNEPYVYYHDAPWFDKFPCVLWHPQDSLPSLPVVADNAHKVKNMWVKAAFAQRDLHEKGHTHVELYPLLLDTSHYREFGEEEKKANREKYKIEEDCLVWGFVARNQARKKFGTLLQGFKMFLDNNPSVNSKVIFVTCPWEGWSLTRFAEEFGIDKNLVIVPHLCHSCEHCELLPITKETLTCPNCGEEKFKTITIEKGVSEKQLVEIYNLMSGYLQASDSGGFEAGALECLRCSVPLATVNYSFGESFCVNEDVFKLDYIDSFECPTGFLKAQIKPESIAEFMQLVHDKPEEMKARGQRSNIWAEKTFNADDILKRIENFIDALPADHGYDFNFRTEKLQPNAPFPTATDDVDFIKELVWNFFGNKIDENHQDFKTITQRFANGTTRQQIYEESKEMVLNKTGKTFDPSEFFKDNGKKRLMWDMAGDYGDSYIGLTVLDRLRELYPATEWDIYVCCLPQYKEIYQHLDYIAGFVPYTGVKHFELWEGTRNHKKWVDVWISPQIWRGATHNGCDFQEFNPNSTNFRLTVDKSVA